MFRFSVHASIKQGFVRAARYSRDCGVFVTMRGQADSANRRTLMDRTTNQKIEEQK
ncbi:MULTISPECIES: hypothetical protein [Burkholderia]|uniref:hypothetical protein n=1 Tax=Burkholderia TaxID=32008 RepID=UPI0003A4D4DA|nr:MULTISPECIES: hypothetical protein [Burkholderia]